MPESKTAGEAALERVLRARFYLHPVGAEAALALQCAIEAGAVKRPLVIWTFARIAATYPAARSAFEKMRNGDADRVRLMRHIIAGGDDPDFPNAATIEIDSPEMLDMMWMEFGVTGDAAPVLRVISVLDREDNVRRRLSEWLAAVPHGRWNASPYREYRESLVRWSLPIDYERGSIDAPLDLDLQVALLAQHGQLKFDQLPVKLPQGELVQLAMKSAAVWSLRGFAQDHAVVARLCAAEAVKPGGAARAHLQVTHSQVH